MWLNGSPSIAQGLPLEITKGEYLLGRDRECQVIVLDLSVSRQHARITPLSSTSVTIEDLRSRNGTYVNNTRVARATATAGDRIVLGAVEFVLAASPLAMQVANDEGVSTARLRRDLDSVSPQAEKLTRAQRRVLKFLLDGLDEQQIAPRCGCKPRTAHNHIQAIYRAFDVHSRQQLLARFVVSPSGITEPGE